MAGAPPSPFDLHQRWKLLCGDERPKPWEAENTSGFFRDLQGRPELIDEALAGVPRASAIAARLRQVFRACPFTPTDLYLVVRAPPPTTERSASRMARAFVGSVERMARQLGDGEVRARIAAITQVAVVAGPRPAPASDGWESLVYELEGAFFQAACPDELAGAMGEAAYSLAASSWLGHHVLWPLARRFTDPYRPFFDLWRHGLEVRIEGPVLEVFRPEGTDRP